MTEGSMFSHWPLLLIIGLPAVILVLLLVLRRPFMGSFKRKHVFITGGSSGIGLAIAKKALKEGASVTLVSRNMANLAAAAETLLNELQCGKDNVRCEVGDVGDYVAISGALDRAWSWKPIDVLVCNAGLTRGGYLGESALRDLEVIVQTNFMGVVNTLHAALPRLKARSQAHPISVVITASLASLFFMYGHSVYTATKYALRGLAEGLRFELIPYSNMRVSLICPFFTSTPFLDEADKEKEIKRLLKWVNLYSRRYAESADSVAKRAIQAMKSGSFLVTTTPLGVILAALGRGFTPADNLAVTLVETVMFIPFRMVSLVCTIIFRAIVCHHSKPTFKITPDEELKASL